MEERDYLRIIQKQQSNEKGKQACKNVLEFFNGNRDDCSKAYVYYEEYRSNRDKYVLAPVFRQNIGEFIEKAYLLITVNEIEEGVLLRYLSEKSNAVLKSFLVGESVYHLCTIRINDDEYTIVHTRSKRTGDEFMRRTINSAVRILGIEKIKYIYLLGICYGMDFNTQKLGDVIISNRVLGYRVNFRDDSTVDEIEVEPEEEFNETPNIEYIDKIASFFCYYEVNNYNFGMSPYKIDIKFGKYLSANCLMSSKKAKESILKQLGKAKPRAMAGEMEACGVFKSLPSSETNIFKNWLIIKSICDWGENKNLFPDDADKNDFIKNSIQAYAMVNTCNAFHTLLNKELLYKEEN